MAGQASAAHEGTSPIRPWANVRAMRRWAAKAVGGVAAIPLTLSKQAACNNFELRAVCWSYALSQRTINSLYERSQHGVDEHTYRKIDGTRSLSKLTGDLEGNCALGASVGLGTMGIGASVGVGTTGRLAAGLSVLDGSLMQ